MVNKLASEEFFGVEKDKKKIAQVKNHGARFTFKKITIPITKGLAFFQFFP